MSDRSTVLVMGGGIQGCCTALALANHGVRVTLVDRDEQVMNRASLRNEGKIHLGLVYANDPSMATAGLQLQGALTFWPLLSEFTGCNLDDLPISTRFHYVVATDSLMDPAELSLHYERVQQLYDEALRDDPKLNYLGRRPGCLVRRLSSTEVGQFFREDRLAAGFFTEERAVSTEHLAALLQKAVAESPNIEFLPGRRVDSVARKGGGFRVKGDGLAGRWLIDADQLVNATWEGRARLDRQLGLDSDGWLYRLKYRAIVRIPPELREAPSATMVIGRYGDVVIRPDGTAYLSWYPEAMRGWSHDEKTPDSWHRPCQGKVSEAETQQITSDMSRALEQWYPGIAGCSPLLVDAGVIVARGQTDVHDKASELHQRSHVGVTSVDGYHSLDAGKLTTSPMFARIAAERVVTA